MLQKQLKNSMVKTTVDVHLLLTKLVLWSHVLVDSVAAAVDVVAIAAVAAGVVVSVVDAAVVVIAAETVAEAVGKPTLKFIF
jgi:hypothetical protein